MFWRTLVSISLLTLFSGCAASQELVVPETTIQFEVAAPEVIVSEESPSTPEAQVERFLLILMEVLADVDRPAEIADFETVATEELSELLATDFNFQKEQGYGYEDLDGVDVWFSPIEYPVVFAGEDGLPEFPESLEVQLVGCFIDNGVELGRDPLLVEVSSPTKTFVRASLVEQSPTWKLTGIEWSTETDTDPDWCLA